MEGLCVLYTRNKRFSNLSATAGLGDTIEMQMSPLRAAKYIIVHMHRP